MIAPGFGPVGFGIALLAVGGVLVAKGHDIAGIACDLLGVIALFAAFRTYRAK